MVVRIFCKKATGLTMIEGINPQNPMLVINLRHREAAQSLLPRVAV